MEADLSLRPRDVLGTTSPTGLFSHRRAFAVPLANVRDFVERGTIVQAGPFVMLRAVLSADEPTTGFIMDVSLSV